MVIKMFLHIKWSRLVWIGSVFGSSPECPNSECAEIQMVKSLDFSVTRISDVWYLDFDCISCWCDFLGALQCLQYRAKRVHRTARDQAMTIRDRAMTIQNWTKIETIPHLALWEKDLTIRRINKARKSQGPSIYLHDNTSTKLLCQSCLRLWLLCPGSFYTTKLLHFHLWSIS